MQIHKILLLTFKFLQALCNNCHREFQDFLRQPDENNMGDLNIVTETSQFLMNLKAKDFGMLIFI